MIYCLMSATATSRGLQQYVWLGEEYLCLPTLQKVSVDFTLNNWQPAASPFPVIFTVARKHFQEPATV